MKLEYREFSTGDEVTTLIGLHRYAVQFWLHVHNITTPMGSLKYCHLATFVLNLHPIPASNADSECVFSLVRQNKTEFHFFSCSINCFFFNYLPF